MFAAPWLVTLRESMRRFFKKTWRAIRYLGLFVWSILCHVLLLTLTIAPLALPALALFVLYHNWETVEGYAGSFKESERLAQALSLLIGAGARRQTVAANFGSERRNVLMTAASS